MSSTDEGADSGAMKVAKKKSKFIGFLLHNSGGSDSSNQEMSHADALHILTWLLSTSVLG